MVPDGITALPEFQALRARVESKDDAVFGSLGLQRSARYVTTAAFYAALGRPILFLTDRPEQALLAFDEIGFWQPKADRYLFPAPEPHFYENADWSLSVRRDRIQTDRKSVV